MLSLPSLTSLSAQFTENVAAGTKASTDLSAQVQEDWQAVRVLLGPNSPLAKQLDNCVSSCQGLNRNVATVEPSLSALHVSVESLTSTEASLVHDLKQLGEKLADAQASGNNSVFEMELSAKFAENTQLQLQVQRLSAEKGELQRELHTKVTEIEDVRLSLAGLSAKRQEVENRIQQLESDKLTLQSEVALAAKQTQEERDMSIASNEQIKDQYERQFQSLQQEKENLQKGTHELICQLDDVRDSLVRRITRPVTVSY